MSIPPVLKGASLALALSAALGLSGPAAAQEPLRILFSVPTFAYPYFVHMQTQVEDEAAQLGGVEIIGADGQLSAPKQVADIETAIVQGVDGIIIGPNDADGLSAPIQAAIDAGVPVVTIDRPVNNVPGVLAHVSADNVLGAEAQGRLIAERYPDGATIVNLQGVPGDQTALDRSTGIHNILDADPDKYVFVAEQTARFNRDQGLSVTENVLSGLAELPQVIVAGNDDMALGALQAIEARGLTGQIAIIGYDGSPEALAAVRSGGLLATVEQFPGQQGRTALRILVDQLRNGTAPESQNNFIAPVAITQENLDQAERIGEVP